MSKHIGIVACSAEGAALCYRTICAEGASLLGEYDHPEVSMHTFSLRSYMDALDIDDWDFSELVCGVFSGSSRSSFVHVIEDLQKKHGCDAVILGCTEIPLLVSQEDSTLPVLDSTRILARAALNYAIQAQVAERS